MGEWTFILIALPFIIHLFLSYKVFFSVSFTFSNTLRLSGFMPLFEGEIIKRNSVFVIQRFCLWLNTGHAEYILNFSEIWYSYLYRRLNVIASISNGYTLLDSDFRQTTFTFPGNDSSMLLRDIVIPPCVFWYSIGVTPPWMVTKKKINDILIKGPHKTGWSSNQIIEHIFYFCFIHSENKLCTKMFYIFTSRISSRSPG